MPNNRGDPILPTSRSGQLGDCEQPVQKKFKWDDGMSCPTHDCEENQPEFMKSFEVGDRCCSCGEIPVGPYNSLSCGHIFGREAARALERANINTFQCPGKDFDNGRCQEILETALLRPDKARDKDIQKKMVKCINAKQGCPTTMQYKSHKSHLDIECPYADVRCPNCTEYFQRRVLDDHKKDCPYAEVRCPNCTAKFQRRLLDDHKKDCPYAEVRCPNCTAKFQRRLLDDHKKDCQSLTCDLAEPACSYAVSSPPAAASSRVESPPSPLAAVLSSSVELQPAPLAAASSSRVELPPSPHAATLSSRVELRPAPHAAALSSRVELQPSPLAAAFSSRVELPPSPHAAALSSRVELRPAPLAAAASSRVKLPPSPHATALSSRVELPPSPHAAALSSRVELPPSPHAAAAAASSRVELPPAPHATALSSRVELPPSPHAAAASRTAAVPAPHAASSSRTAAIPAHLAAAASSRTAAVPSPQAAASSSRTAAVPAPQVAASSRAAAIPAHLQQHHHQGQLLSQHTCAHLQYLVDHAMTLILLKMNSNSVGRPGNQAIAGEEEKLNQATAVETLPDGHINDAEPSYWMAAGSQALERQEAGTSGVIPRLITDAVEIPSVMNQCGIKFMVTDFSDKRAKAIKGELKRGVYGPQFYTHEFGYLMVPILYPNGDGTGAGTHLSIFIAVQMGKFDSKLRWPMSGRITISILSPERVGGPAVRHSFNMDTASLSYDRPTSEVNQAIGMPKALDLNLLKQPSDYLVDDTLFIQIVVDPKLPER